MTEDRSAIVVERNAARQTTEPLVLEIVPQLGRLAESAWSPNSCLGDPPTGQPVSTRTGRGGQFTRSEQVIVSESQASVGVDVSQAATCDKRTREAPERPAADLRLPKNS
jgi:hypothetical protein